MSQAFVLIYTDFFGVVAELYIKADLYAVVFKAGDAGVSQRRFESGRRQTVTVTECTLWQGSLNWSATSPMTTSDADTDVHVTLLCFL